MINQTVRSPGYLSLHFGFHDCSEIITRAWQRYWIRFYTYGGHMEDQSQKIDDGQEAGESGGWDWSIILRNVILEHQYNIADSVIASSSLERSPTTSSWGSNQPLLPQLIEIVTRLNLQSVPTSLHLVFSTQKRGGIFYMLHSANRSSSRPVSAYLMLGQRNSITPILIPWCSAQHSFDLTHWAMLQGNFIHIIKKWSLGRSTLHTP